MTFSILTVCTGNICRSPAVERMLAATMPAGVRVSSAGTGAVVGAPVSPEMARLMLGDGVSPEGFVARQVSPSIVAEADLVLALTRAHRSAVVRLRPAAVRRTFTLLEFARIVGSEEFSDVNAAEDLAEVVDFASGHRLLGEVVADDDVPDPYRQGAEVFAEAYGLIRGAVLSIARALR